MQPLSFIILAGNTYYLSPEREGGVALEDF